MAKRKVLKVSAFERDYSQHVTQLSTLAHLNSMLERTAEWVPRLALDTPSLKPADVYKKLQRRRDALRKTTAESYGAHMAQPRCFRGQPCGRLCGTHDVATVPLSAIAGYGTPYARKPLVSGLTQVSRILDPNAENAGTVRSSQQMVKPIGEPDDDDTTKNLIIECAPHPTADVVYHTADIHDQTHLWSTDDDEEYHYMFAFGYELPPAPCDGYVLWTGNAYHELGHWGDAEHRYIYAEWLTYPRRAQMKGLSNDPIKAAPEYLEDFLGPWEEQRHWDQTNRRFHSYWAENFNQWVYQTPRGWRPHEQGPAYYEDVLFGVLKVQKDQVVVPWIGIQTVLTGREGDSNALGGLYLWTNFPYGHDPDVAGISYEFWPADWYNPTYLLDTYR